MHLVAVLVRVAVAGLALLAVLSARADPGFEPTSGTLLVRTSPDTPPLPVPALDTRIGVRVTGPVARTRVTQRFANPTGLWLEGVYVFPLPDDAAVDHLEMHVGGRVIEGRIEEREQARRSYERARAGGQRASLVEQERPNLFTASLANIGPDDAIEVVIEYQHTLRWDAGRMELRLPLVAAPRYLPGGGPETPGAGHEASGHAVPGIAAPGARIEIEIDAGVPVASITSPSHAPLIERTGPAQLRVELDGVPCDRDLVLVWELEASDDSLLAAFTEQRDDGVYALLMLVPPAAPRPRRLVREIVFVVDTSGSMSGASIEQGRAALALALDALAPDDFFNVIEFDSTTRRLFPGSVRAAPEMLRHARHRIARLQADGGTEMLPALEAALIDEGHGVDVRQIVFITDGAVGNESRLFETLARGLGRSRLFTVGIGSAPSSYFMRRAARHGRGSFTYVGRTDEVGERMGDLLEKLERPLLRDVEVRWADPAEAWPERVADLYAGEPVLVTARLPRASGEVRVSGHDGEGAWSVRAALDAPRDGLGIHRLWARRRIESLMDGLASGADASAVRAEVVELALRHHLVSKWTSLVAVERTPARPRGAPGASGRVATAIPHGWGLPGSLPQGGSPAPLLLLLGTGLALVGSLWLGLQQLGRCEP